ncbi:MAG: PHP domain-containing protein, partial [Nanoarchaeota archaeon]|nr:PHP domain-containing protein [Nanoarchaeota archaeon]
MKNIKNKILECKSCELYKIASNKIIGIGKKNPKVLFIQSIPTEKEDQTGIPMSGECGEKLKQIIKDYSIHSFAAINAIKCKPPKNRDPYTQELMACRNFLSEQIKLLTPQKIIALGKTALAQLDLSSDTILSRVGTVEVSEFGKVLILPDMKYLLNYPDYILPHDIIKQFLSDEDKTDKIKLNKLVMNYQKAEEIAKFEMISAELASLHEFCKQSGKRFVDVNQKDVCELNDKLTICQKLTQTNEIDLFESELNSGKLKNTKLFVFFSVEKGNLEWVGWVDREYVDAQEMGYHFKAEKNCKKIMHANLFPISDLLEIMIEDEEEIIIEKQPCVHLHVHSEYSIGDGYGEMSHIADSLYKKGFTACALTDHGTLAGTIYFQKALLEKNIKPIFGCEAYVVLEDDKKSTSYHLTILVKNKTGWNNLNK